MQGARPGRLLRHHRDPGGRPPRPPAIVERSIGLGQIVALLGEKATVELDEVGDGADTFWRRYRMWGDGFSYIITETFAKELYATQ